MADPTETSSLDALNSTIDNSDVLRESPGVKGAQKTLNEEAKSKPNYFAESGQVIDQLNSSIQVWEDPKSSAADITASALDLGSKVLYAASAIPGLDIVAAPLGFVVGLIGSIVGAFGSKQDTNYYEILNQMLTDATEKLNSEQVDQELAGALQTMKDNYWTVNDILNRGAVPADAPVIADFGTSTFTAAASQQLGAAFKNLELNLDYDKRDNWDNAAETYAAMVQVLTFKLMYLSQGVAYFKLVDANTSDPGRRSAVVLDFLNNQYAPSSDLGQATPYMIEPNLTNAIITQAVYRLPEDKFRQVGALMAYYLDNPNPNVKEPRPHVWPGGASQYRFEVRDESQPDYGKHMVRLATWYNRQHQDPPRVLFNSLSFHSRDDEGYATVKTHWMLWADTDKYSPQPYYRWYLQASNDEHHKGQLNVVIFEVVPTEGERTKYGIPDPQGNTLVIISDAGEDHNWRASHEDHDLHHTSYADIIKGHHEGYKCLWVLLDETQ